MLTYLLNYYLLTSLLTYFFNYLLTSLLIFLLIYLITYLLTYLLTYSKVQSPSWTANWFAASQKIPRISRNPKVHYRTHKRPPPVSILGQPNPVHIPTSHLLEIHPNTIHPSTPRSPQWSLSLRSPHQNPILQYIIFMKKRKQDLSILRRCQLCIKTLFSSSLKIASWRPKHVATMFL